MKTALFYTAIVCAALAMIMLMFMSKCMKEKPKVNNYDSLNFVRAIEKKQAGREIAILMNENTQLRKDKMKDKHEKDSLKQHEKQLMVTNAFLIKKMRESAPVPCQPYIDSCNEYHTQIESAKDAAYDKQGQELAKSDSSNTKLMKVIGIQKMEAEKDSTNYADNMKKKDIELANADKKAKRAQFFSKLVTWSALVVVGVVTVVTMVY